MDCQKGQSDGTKHSVVRLLLSHHPPEHIARTLCLKWGRSNWRICARCTGTLLGTGVFATAWALGARVELGASALLAILACLLMPAVIDFNAQLITRRESTNRRRLVTGAMFGFATAWSIGAALTGQWWVPMPMMAIVGGSFIWLVVSKRRLVRLLQHLQLYSEYFERCRCEDLRRASRKRVVKV